MEVGGFLSVWIAFSLLCGAKCDEDIELLNDKLDIMKDGVQILSDRFDAFENQMSIDRSILMNKQRERILSLKTELKTNIRQHVTETLSDIIGGESVEGMINAQVISEMRHLKRANHQMKRQLHQMKTSLGQVQEDNMMYREALQKGEGENSELTTCLVNSELLTFELAERDRQIGELTQMVKVQNDSCKPSADTVNKETDSVLETTVHTSTISPTTAVEPTSLATRLTTSDPLEERSRILLAPLWSSLLHQFRQVNIHTNTINIYSYFSLKRVDSLVYISKLNSLMIGLYSPYKIISSQLNSARITTVRHNVRSYGIAADEGREIVFLTTLHPSKTISKMTLQGRHFTAIVSLSGYGGDPRGIAVNTKTKIIYACNYVKLFSVRYDGSGLTTLDTGRYHMNAVTLDITNGLLYYSKQKKLMKMSLSTNTSSEVTQFSFYIWNLLYYMDTVYYISHSSPYGTLGEVDVGHNIVSYTLQTLKVTGVNYFAICLVP